MEKVFNAKKLQNSRIEVKEWSKGKAYASSFTEECFLWGESVERRDSSMLSVDEFRMSYELANRPLVIENAISKWPAFDKWSFSVEST